MFKADTDTIDLWLEAVRTKGATHMLLVTDTFDNEDYPVPVMPWEDVEEVKRDYNVLTYQKVLRVFSM